MKEVQRLDYSKITDDVMDNLITALYMLKRINPKSDVYFNEKNILRVINMGMMQNKNE